MPTRLEDLVNCFQGVIPAMIATCSLDGEPNVTYLSQVYYVDPKRVALSCQFFNKTKKNVLENPNATVIVHDAVAFEAWRLRLRYHHEETSGELFDVMATRIEVIASHTGMAGVFKLISADVYDVLAVEKVEGFMMPPDPVLDAVPTPVTGAGPLTELRGLQVVSERIARADDLETLLATALTALDELFGFSHSMVLVPDDAGTRVVAIASRGYGAQCVGAEVRFGVGAIGAAAERRRMVRITGVGEEMRYGRAVRGRVAKDCSAQLVPEVPLPGLPDAQAQLALPLVAGDRLVGVLAVESRDPLHFDEWDETYLKIVGSQIATGIDRVQQADDEGDAAAPPSAKRAAARGRTPRRFVYFREDDCVFVDGEYLVRSVPARILWRLLGWHVREGRTEFCNRELRMDASLGLPPVKDNLESRLILLRKRLAEKCPDLRMVPVRRGRFELVVDCAPELEERDRP
jgi:GAF domain-containing protein/pyridoxamine 5'-phosphate oxidase-like protein